MKTLHSPFDAFPDHLILLASPEARVHFHPPIFERRHLADCQPSHTEILAALGCYGLEHPNESIVLARPERIKK